jgi:ribose-phosphate pyrophosphokinase
MHLTIFSGRANLPLTKAIVSVLGIEVGTCTIENFPDDELHVEIHETVRGHDVYLIQPTVSPVADHLLELLLLSDACRRAEARRLTAVVPYFGYARQDRRVQGTEPIGARLIADIMSTRLDRIIAVDLHNPAFPWSIYLPSPFWPQPSAPVYPTMHLSWRPTLAPPNWPENTRTY